MAEGNQMRGVDLLADGFGRVRENVHHVVTGLTPDQLASRLDGAANSIAWLVWHLTRVQDDHVSDVADVEQTWTAEGWMQRFELPFHPSATGYGHTSDEVGQVRVSSPDLLTGYYDAVHRRTIDYVTGLADADFDRIVDDRWHPPVSLGVRLVSVMDDDAQHVGQAAFVRGLVLRGS